MRTNAVDRGSIRTVLADADDPLLNLPTRSAHSRERLENLDGLATVNLEIQMRKTYERENSEERTPRLGSNLGSPGARFPPVMSLRKLTTSWFVPSAMTRR